MKAGRQIQAYLLPALLLVMVAITHLGYDLIGSFYTDPARAATAWHHVLRAFPEATWLYLIVWLLLPWQPVPARIAGSAACAWGAIESFQIAACRLQFPMGVPPPRTPLYGGLCEIATGWPIYMTTLVIVLTVCLLSRSTRHGQDADRNDTPD